MRPRPSRELTLALALTAALGCSSKPPPGPPPKEKVPVSVAVVERKAMPFEVRAIGHVEAFATVAVKPRIGGQITRVDFAEGSDVKAGDRLFTIDSRPFEAMVAQAEANLERDRARAKNAESDAHRYEDLVGKEFVTAEQFDQAKSTAAEAKATVKADEAMLADARLQLGYSSITAPISGRTGSLLVHAGNIIKANDDKPLVVINQLEPILVAFAVPEQHLGAIKERRAAGKLGVAATPSGEPGRAQAGELSFIDNAVDPQTGTLLLKASFPNHDRSLWPGQFTDVVLTLGQEENAVVVPLEAVQTGQNGQFVFTVKDDLQAESRPVTVARTLDQSAIIAKGLAGGERVVTDGQLRLSPGAVVEIKESLGGQER